MDLWLRFLSSTPIGCVPISSSPVDQVIVGSVLVNGELSPESRCQTSMRAIGTYKGPADEYTTISACSTAALVNPIVLADGTKLHFVIDSNAGVAFDFSQFTFSTINILCADDSTVLATFGSPTTPTTLECAESKTDTATGSDIYDCEATAEVSAEAYCGSIVPGDTIQIKLGLVNPF